MTERATELVEEVLPSDAHAVTTDDTSRSAAISAAPDSIIVEVTHGPVLGESEDVMGGEWLTSCTSGYSVRKGTLTGILTAEHCTPGQWYEGRDILGPRISAPMLDVIFYPASERARGVFRADTYNPPARVITGVADPGVGSYVCHWGKGTGYSCGYIYAKGLCARGYCNLTVMENWMSNDGDSGGPWFNAYTAMGIHSGRDLLNGKTRTTFTPLRFAVSNLGVTVIIE